MKRIGLLILMIASAALAGPKNPLVIGHRGASGYLPEHTLESFSLAIEMGADYIEPDLVMTKDGVLIVRHENEISLTTDVAEKFPTRKATKTIDGLAVTGWFAEDFTLAEIKTLRAKERLAGRDHANDFKFQIATFREVLSLLKAKSKEKKRVIGVYPETKHPTYFSSIGLPLEGAMLKDLAEAGLSKPGSPVFIQSFEFSNLKALRKKTKLPLVFLVDSDLKKQPYDFVASGDKRTFGDLMTPAGLKELKTVVDGIGPYKELILPFDKDRRWTQATDLVSRAHAAGLIVHAYTFRSDKDLLPKDVEGDAGREYLKFYELGVDGVFSDFPDQALGARARFAISRQLN